jgi:hypothetical protein
MNNKAQCQSSPSTLARQIVTTLLIGLAVILILTTSTYPTFAQDQDLAVRLKSREFVPDPGVEQAVSKRQQDASLDERIHVLVQFWQVPTDAEQATLENAGVKLLAYVPANTWFASIPAGLSLQSDALAGIRWIGAIQPEDRTALSIRTGGIGQHAVNDDGTVSLDVYFFADVTNVKVSQLLTEYKAVIEAKSSEFHRFTIRLDRQAISLLANEDVVQWVTEAAPPKTVDNDGVRARTNVDIVQAAPYNLSGSGVDLGEWDGGRVDTHIDFSNRLIVVDSSASVGDHATHVAGTMAGDGSNSASQGGTSFQWKGMAPGADIISYYWDNNLTDHNDAINTYGIELSQNSWGYTVDEGWFDNCYLYGNYDYDAPNYDDIVTGLYGKRISVIFAAGNERNDGDCGMNNTPPYINYANVGPPATAKNIIAVGATNSDDDSMTDFSSWGPVDDGRIKPDVVAPGCEAGGEGYIHSTLPGNTYGAPAYCGTSMAAPTVSGISGLIIEQYRATFGVDPLPSTVKALLIQTAIDLDDGTSYYNPGPDYASGYGRVDVQAAVDEVIVRHVREDQVSNGQMDAFTVNVLAGTPSLKVTLVWDDEPGTVNATPALVNNLDLVLVEPNGITTRLPWVLDPANPSSNATTGTDSVNNVEQVQVNNPTAGTWEVRVIGTNVPVGPQPYSLVGQTFTTSGPVNVGPLEYSSHIIDDDNNNNSVGNNDGIVNPGETIELFVELLNAGTDEAIDALATISTSSPYVTFIYNTSSGYGNIPGGGMATNLNDFDFEISSNAPNGHIIHFDLNVTAGNGGPWSDGFDVPVVGTTGSGNVALISDQTELQAISSILDDMGLIYDIMNNNWNGTQGIYTSDYSFLSGYDLVVWYASGSGAGRLITQQEHDALEIYLQAGGRLLVTGYDTLGSPSDPLLADLVRSHSYGDGPFTYDYIVTDGTHPIMDGPFGSFPTGTVLMAGHFDHDQAEADTARGAVTVAELSTGFDKIIATELASTGKVVYWNGNRDVRDWVGLTTTIALGESEPKRDVTGPISITNEELAARAERLDAVTIPPEANYSGDGPTLHLDAGVIPAPQVDIVPLASQSVTFIATGDTVNVLYDPYWWQAGDYAEGIRTLSLDSVEHLDYTLYISDNYLNGAGHLDLQLSINGQLVGSFSVLPGEFVKNVSFDFPAIGGPTYVIRLEETNTVDPGAGSITLPLNLSTMVLSNSQPDILKNTLHWLVQGALGGSDPHEPNNTPTDCTPIFFDVPITDPTIDPAGDWDYYCFTGNDGQVIAADVDAWINGSPLDSWLTLFGSDGTSILAENDDYDGLDSHLEYSLPHNGTFYLRVRSFAHPCCGGPDHTYALFLTGIAQVIDAPWFDDIESGINRWTAGGFWHQVEDGVSPYPESHSPTRSWWYGQDANGNYDNGTANSGSLTSPTINIPDGALGASLSFWSWYETETNGVDYDQRWVQISVDGGPFQNLAQLSGDPMQAWVEHSLDLSPYVGSQVRIRFYFDTIDSFYNNYRGWYIDDFLLDVVTVPPTGPIVYDSHLIDDDNADNSNGNGDGIVNPGEAIEMYIDLHNLSSTAANNVEACISENSSYVNGFLFNTCSSYGSIPGGGIVTNFDDFDYSISPSAPAGHVIHFTLNVTADNGGPWTTSFDVVVGQPPQPPGPVFYFDYVVDDDNTGQSVGNSNGQINPGETIELYVKLLNAGLGTANAVNACISEGSLYLDGFLFNTCSNYGDLPSSSTALNTDDFDLAVDINAPQGHTIPFTITATAANGGPWSSTFGVMVVGGGSRLYIEPPDQDVPLSGGSFVVDVIVDDTSDLGAFEFDLVYDPAVVHVEDIALGPFLSSTGRNVSEVGPVIDNLAGRTTYGAYSVGIGSGPNGNGIVATITLSPQTTGESNLILEKEQLADVDGNAIPSTTSDGHVTVTNTFFADVDGDGNVDIVDIQLVASRWSCVSGDSCYSSIYDMDNDGDVDIADIQIVACYWGWPNGDFSVCYIPTVLSEEPLESEGILQAPTVWIEPDTYYSGSTGEVFTATVEIANVINLGAFQFDLNYGPSMVQAKNVMQGDFLGSTGRTVHEVGPIIDNTTGTVTYGAYTLGASPYGPDGNGVLATITLETRVQGDIALSLENVVLTNIAGEPPSSARNIYLPIILRNW